MKRDKLEEFVLQNREAFDEFDPDPALWEDIRPASNTRKLNPYKVIWRVAAAVAIFMGSYFVHDVTQNSQSHKINLTEKAPQMDNDFLEAQAYYSVQIQSMETQICKIAGVESMICMEVKEELLELDQVYADLQNDLNDNMANQEVVEAMIMNYRLKVQILEEVLNQLKQVHENNNNESKTYAF